AGAGMDAAYRVDPLHRRHPGEQARAAMRGHLELEPGDVARRLAWGAGGGLADHCATVDVLPVRPRIVTADGLAIEQERRARLAERPGKLAVVAGFAFVDLRALGMERDDGALARRREGGGNRADAAVGRSEATMMANGNMGVRMGRPSPMAHAVRCIRVGPPY